MNSHDVFDSSTTEGLPIAPSLGDSLEAAHVPKHSTLVDGRILFISCCAVLIAVVAAFVAQGLIHLIAFFTNLSFYGTLSFSNATPANNTLGLWVVGVPVVGGLVIGVMARFGSKAIRGHGIPEAMEQVLINQSRIPPRITWLKPLSAAISIGTGGPFGAEGPIIATGGALGSLVGQLLRTTGAERKVLLSAGAAAGMAATFGCPVAAVVLAVELLLFEFRPRSVIPVALACATAAGIRAAIDGSSAVFEMPTLADAGGVALVAYMLIGAVIGVISVVVTRAVYAVEDLFEHLPVHWMWWPALGGIAVGLVGYFAPRTLGVGYKNIVDIISGKLTIQVILTLCAMKFLSWSISLGSGTSGGTLAPLLTLGSALGAALGLWASGIFPHFGIDPRMAALVGMAALFGGASRAWLTSIVFAFETTHQTSGILPLLGGCTLSYLVSCFLMRYTIMTEKLARRGVRVPNEYAPDFLDLVLVSDLATKNLVVLRGNDSLQKVRAWINTGASGTSHQGFPVLDEKGFLKGVLTRRDLLASAAPDSATLISLIKRPAVVVYADCTLRAAADHMVNHGIGRLPVILRADPTRVVGIITRSDLLSAHRKRLAENHHAVKGIDLASVMGAKLAGSVK